MKVVQSTTKVMCDIVVTSRYTCTLSQQLQSPTNAHMPKHADYVKDRTLSVPTRESIPPAHSGKVRTYGVGGHSESDVFTTTAWCFSLLRTHVVHLDCVSVQVLPEIPGAALSWGSTTNRSSYRLHNVQERESDRLTAMRENQVGG